MDLWPSGRMERAIGARAGAGDRERRHTQETQEEEQKERKRKDNKVDAEKMNQVVIRLRGELKLKEKILAPRLGRKSLPT